MPQVESVILKPGLCTEHDFALFCKLVRQGGEVASLGLEVRVKAAKALVFLRVDNSAVGVAALKAPSATYRDGVFRNAGVPNSAAQFELELGWVFVLPEHRGRKYARVLSAAALSQAAGQPVFATTRLDNVPMQTTLEHLSLRRLGNSWRSDKGRKPFLLLYVTP